MFLLKFIVLLLEFMMLYILIMFFSKFPHYGWYYSYPCIVLQVGVSLEVEV
jgi:hypothetical protein